MPSITPAMCCVEMACFLKTTITRKARDQIHRKVKFSCNKIIVLDPTDIITYQETTLFINGTSTFDSGSYRCIADNSFPLTVDGQAEPFKLYYDLNVTVLATVAGKIFEF